MTSSEPAGPSDEHLAAAQRLALIAVMGSAGRVWTRDLTGTAKAEGYQDFANIISGTLRMQGPRRGVVIVRERAQGVLDVFAATDEPGPRLTGKAMAAQAALDTLDGTTGG